MPTAAQPTLQYEDAQVRVTRWDFEPGTATGHHLHSHDYVVVPVTDGRVRALTLDGGGTDSVLKAGQSYARPVGGAHDVVNIGDAPLAFVEIELKHTAPVAPPVQGGRQ
ncbi:cupin domain-containing protein [Streptomyces sp. NPDC002935]|uniref:cupin domain-containing protein n=1 Tax=Streptomyces sp. NPDC002935 TaxID=3154545 RepID=UPI0033BC2331